METTPLTLASGDVRQRKAQQTKTECECQIKVLSGNIKDVDPRISVIYSNTHNVE